MPDNWAARTSAEVYRIDIKARRRENRETKAWLHPEACQPHIR
jgi:hypothetical protein